MKRGRPRKNSTNGTTTSSSRAIRPIRNSSMSVEPTLAQPPSTRSIGTDPPTAGTSSIA
ncbi:conserved hypothetical protein [Ricinus communis]|uniref:Uncharacterized protein n=1 Tax=Ricinus communis TaxID=3988 RepID=B9RKK6_RICCO|nr:conserved hypothetical protein [Ricinus communis]